MVFFIIFGTRGVTFTKGEGTFHCPRCGGGSSYCHKTVRRFFTLYFIPLIPLDQLGEYVECNHCQGTYHTDILSYEPGLQEQDIEALFMVAMKQVMIAMLLADGVIDDNEVRELMELYEKLAGVHVTEKDLREEIEVIQREGSTALELIQRVGPGLNDKGKEMVMVAAYQIAAADGRIDESEQRLMTQIAGALDISDAHFRGIMAEVENPRIN